MSESLLYRKSREALRLAIEPTEVNIILEEIVSPSQSFGRKDAKHEEIGMVCFLSTIRVSVAKNSQGV